MKCNRCGATWEIAGIMDYPNICPYCGTVIIGCNQDSAGILRDIIDEHRQGILLEPARLSSLLIEYLDLSAPDIPSIRIAVEEGIGEYLYNAVNNGNRIKRSELEKASHLMTDELGYSPDQARSILSSFEYALDVKQTPARQNYHDKDDTYYNLAMTYDHLNNDVSEAYLRVSADTGNKKAIWEYAYRIRDRWRGIIDSKTWYQWNQKADCKGNIHRKEAQHELFIASLYGIGTDRLSDRELAPWFERLINAGDIEAGLEAAVRILLDTSLSWYYTCFTTQIRQYIHNAAENDVSYARIVQDDLKNNASCDIDSVCESPDPAGLAHQIALYFDDGNHDEQFQYWCDLAADLGYVEPVDCESFSDEDLVEVVQLALDSLRREDYAMLIKYLKIAVRCGYNEDYSLIGSSEILGAPGVEIDYQDGFIWAIRCYNQWKNGDFDSIGNAAQLEFAIGFCYMTGLGTTKDEDQGKKFWKAAIDDADESDLRLITAIGQTLRRGDAEVNGHRITTKPDYQIALHAFQKATSYGDRDSIYFLGEMNERGQGVHKDTNAARLFYERAAEMGDQEAIEWLREN